MMGVVAFSPMVQWGLKAAAVSGASFGISELVYRHIEGQWESKEVQRANALHEMYQKFEALHHTPEGKTHCSTVDYWRRLYHSDVCNRWGYLKFSCPQERENGCSNECRSLYERACNVSADRFRLWNRVEKIHSVLIPVIALLAACVFYPLLPASPVFVSYSLRGSVYVIDGLRLLAAACMGIGLGGLPALFAPLTHIRGCCGGDD